MDMVPFNDELYKEILKLKKTKYNKIPKKEAIIKQHEYEKTVHPVFLDKADINDVKGKSLITRKTALKLYHQRIHIFKHLASPLLNRWIDILFNPDVKYSTLSSIEKIKR
jgi:hypothetical protein